MDQGIVVCLYLQMLLHGILPGNLSPETRNCTYIRFHAQHVFVALLVLSED